MIARTSLAIPDQADYANAGLMHLYLNYAGEHGMKLGENSLVFLILCAVKGVIEAYYVLKGLPNKVLAVEYQTELSDEKQLVKELVKTRCELKTRWLAPRADDVEAGK